MAGHGHVVLLVRRGRRESTEPGWESCLFSDISAAEVTSAIISPELRPGFLAERRQAVAERGVRPEGRCGAWEMAPISHTASAIWSAANADRLGMVSCLRNNGIVRKHSGLSVTALASIVNVAATERRRSRQAPSTLGLAADAIGILNPLVALDMALANWGAGQQLP